MGIVAIAALIEDHLLDAGMWRSLGHGGYLWCVGLAGLVLTLAFASVSSHRGFSHSLAALALEAASLWLIFPRTALPFAIAFTSHVLLDLMNKKSVRLAYPAKKGFRLGWFYADRLANKFFAFAGSVWLILTVILCMR